ncbi:abortive infection family protein [Levilactobacillus bambusae]|uniref:Abortive infection protein-like C-terminal domain-containing protein n=1 Tax=Levilactobacillus bambusae TaxID=2024736 RepID=A0A2V1N0G2_9LACO|nr:abortive infection family protein [Levilactobacillus bambusae]PWG00503.1 hypothetical protein DCM90_06150 [Levilactobacillus bambusae]
MLQKQEIERRLMLPELKQYDVITVNESFDDVVAALSDGRYDSAINYSKSMLEACSRWIYKQKIGRDLPKNMELKQKVMGAIDTLEVQSADDKLFKQMIQDMSLKIGKIRNNTSESHGQASRKVRHSEVQAEFIATTSTAICNMLLELFFSTKGTKDNIIGSHIKMKNGFELARDNDYIVNDRKSNDAVTYNLEKDTRIIQQICITTKVILTPGLDVETLHNIVQPYLPNDVRLAPELNKDSVYKYYYYSEQCDLYVSIIIESLKPKDGTQIYITMEYPDQQGGGIF